MSKNVRSASELKSLPAYRLEYEEHVPDCNGQGMLFKHIKSGARVAVISNEDENKVFCIAFRTTPTDDTGVPHITEHSVLCGSDKFPPKDPFMELAKGSLNTFLNAFTYPDKTCYPVASCNDQDFNNLMDVYMDAVLHPNTYKFEEIFKQEGWRYELEDKDSPLTINGVVYSEMKGAFSTAESRQQREIMHALFPDTTYGVESGGDPKAIPDLTYEQFLDFHRRYYHPTNSYIYLYGNMDVEDRLEWLDREYLSEYDEQPVDSEVTEQDPIGESELYSFYPVGEDEDGENAGYLAWAFTMGSFRDTVQNEAMSVLCDVLFNVPGAPVREALVKAGIGQDISCYCDTEIRQPSVVMTIRNTSVDKLEDMKKILRETLEKEAREGVNRKSLLGIINGSEFKYCEADMGFPKGLFYGMNILSTWLYDDTMAFEQLHKRDRFQLLRDKIGEGYYEELIRKFMLNGQSVVFQAMAPKKGMVAENEKELTDKLAKMKASMSAAEIDKLIADTAALKAYQAAPSTPEELMTIPMLKREDIDKKAPEYIIEETRIADTDTYFHDVDTNGIIYLKFLFDMDMIPADEAVYTAIAARLAGNMDTENYTYLDYNNEMNIYTGGIGMDASALAILGEKDGYRPMLTLGGSVLENNFDKLLELMEEGTFRTKYANAGRIRELMGESKARLQYIMPARGNRTASRHALAGIFQGAYYNEQLSGLGYYRKVCEVLEMKDEQVLEVAKKAEESLGKLIGSDNLLIDVTCKREVFEKIRPSIEKFVKKLSKVRKDAKEPAKRRGPVISLNKSSDGLKIASEVNYVALAGCGGKAEPTEEGKLAVAANILNTEYLWNNVRVLGGAYGSGFSFDALNGYSTFSSYRDPHLTETLDIYRKAADYIRTFEADERTMTKFVIGTMGGVDAPLSPADKGARALNAKLSGYTHDLLQKKRDAILAADVEDIRSTASFVGKILEDPNVCVVGSESGINSNSDMFGSVQNLL